MKRLLFVADGRSPIALNWIQYFVDQGYEVHLASTFPCTPDLELVSLEVIPVAFSGIKRESSQQAGAPPPRASRSPELWGAAAVGLRTRARQWLGPLTLPKAARRLEGVIERVRPDLVHAMRIPYEGMLAALASRDSLRVPLLTSVWGNDFTLHAPATPLMGHYTRSALRGASALHTDCHRDLRLAENWGFNAQKPGVVLPGAGGIQPELFHPPDAMDAQTASIRDHTVINPRGFRAYVRNDTFFQAIPIVLAQRPMTRFICPTMAGDSGAERWLDELGIAANVELLPRQSRSQMAELFRGARLVVSPSTHDGTPNTLLEAMACGCLPLAGDLESIQEWIEQEENGLLFDPADPAALAKAILEGLKNDDLHNRAQGTNTKIISERAAYPQVMAQAARFYQKLLPSGEEPRVT